MSFDELFRKLRITAYRTNQDFPDESGGSSGEYFFDDEKLVKDVTVLCNVVLREYHDRVAKALYGMESNSLSGLISSFLSEKNLRCDLPAESRTLESDRSSELSFKEYNDRRAVVFAQAYGANIDSERAGHIWYSNPSNSVALEELLRPLT